MTNTMRAIITWIIRTVSKVSHYRQKNKKARPLKHHARNDSKFESITYLKVNKVG